MERWERVVFWLSLAALLGTVLLLARAAAGRHDPWARTPEQGAMIARIIANERSEFLRGDPSADRNEIHWFLSVVSNNRDRLAPKEGWSGVLRRLAPHVTGAKPPTRHRQAVNASLVGCSERKPALWQDDIDGNWDQYSLQWQSLCLDVRDLWVRGEWEHQPGVITWGNTRDSERQLCRGRSRLCLVGRFEGGPIGGNLFFGLADGDACRPGLQEEFVEERCQ
jgi:hypothetical protein